MKTMIRKTLLGLVGTSLGVYMMAVPFAATVSANAAEKPPVQTQSADKKHFPDQKPSPDHHKHHQKHQKFSREEMMQRIRAYYANHYNDAFYQLTPLELVKACANELGFDPQNDTFTLVSEHQNTAVVEVLHDGNPYDINIVRSGYNHWVITSME